MHKVIKLIISLNVNNSVSFPKNWYIDRGYTPLKNFPFWRGSIMTIKEWSCCVVHYIFIMTPYCIVLVSFLFIGSAIGQYLK